MLARRSADVVLVAADADGHHADRRPVLRRRHRVDRVLADDLPLEHVLRVDDRARPGHRHGLFERADPQIGIDRRREGRRQFDPLALHRREPRQREASRRRCPAADRRSCTGPRSSVIADRTRSISAGLAASTVTPGITAPLVSLTTPAMALDWARTIPGNPRMRTDPNAMARAICFMLPPEWSRKYASVRARSRISPCHHLDSLRTAPTVPCRATVAWLWSSSRPEIVKRLSRAGGRRGTGHNQASHHASRGFGFDNAIDVTKPYVRAKTASTELLFRLDNNRVTHLFCVRLALPHQWLALRRNVARSDDPGDRQ